MKNEIFNFNQIIEEVISEYAIPLEQYRDKIGERLKTIISHICLVLYQKRFGYEERVNYWRNEIYNKVSPLFKFKIKNGDNEKTKRKALAKLFSELKLNEPKVISTIIFEKFDKEYGENIKKDDFNDVCRIFALETLSYFLETLCRQDENYLRDFVENL